MGDRDRLRVGVFLRRLGLGLLLRLSLGGLGNLRLDGEDLHCTHDTSSIAWNIPLSDCQLQDHQHSDLRWHPQSLNNSDCIAVSFNEASFCS